MIRTFLLILLSTTLIHAQQFRSVVRGNVKDADTGLPLAQATVQLDGQGSVTDDAGSFRFEGVETGRHTLTVSFVGYQTLVISEILLESGKENVQEVRLAATGRQLQEATVSGSRPPAFNSVQAITAEQTLRYAATYLDPARVATSFAGVAAANDQANGLVIRGNSPNSMQWRLEGVEIVNPNHLSNAGTFSDRPTSAGGGVNILSTQLLATSYFLNGAFPAQYGNAVAGVMDMRLRKGNDERHEFTAQAGLIGLDIAAEGPFSKRSKASYLVNYRYSFTGLLGAMGVNFGGEDIRFQDLSFNLNFPLKKGGNLTVFGLGGISSNIFKPEPDSTKWEFYKDSHHIIYKNKMGAAGVTHALPLGRRAVLNTTFVMSGLQTSRAFYKGDTNTVEYAFPIEDDSLTKSKATGNMTFNYRFAGGGKLKIGAFLTFQYDRLAPLYAYEEFKSRLFQPFAEWTVPIAPGLTGEVGLTASVSKVDLWRAHTHRTLEPRAALRWQVTDSQKLTFSYGLHSQLPLAQLYAAGFSVTGFSGNPNLGPARVHHFVAGYQRDFRKSNSLKIEAYWQEHLDVPTNGEDFSALNLIETRVSTGLMNTGKGRNYGLEATYQQLLSRDFYMVVAGSVYSARYLTGGNEWRKGRFDGRHTFSFTGGKEFKSGARILGVNTKILWLGGFRETPIDLEASKTGQQTVYVTGDPFALKLKDYFRPDLRIYLKKSRASYSTTLALDLQNVSGTKNKAFSYYDAFQQKIVKQKQLGLIPVLSYRWEF
ncbi:prevent-host-death protein [Dyadobacter beijingensis]|uniref:Prevent-host-death protein n=1 Tax=Dyadobacter beijingensis TaxID=365489 RepID=A0ABQ2I981_9BACT|nr:TonB-dependent receptor [Dyadobacter beijingensis]GGN03584.1 prevent-host-death protein [Dyadobacter beijingensis]